MFEIEHLTVDDLIEEITVEPEIKYPSCNSKFSQRKNLYVHVRKFHDDDVLLDLLPAKSSKCEYCDKTFLNKKSLGSYS